MAGQPPPTGNPLPLFNWLLSTIDDPGNWGRWRPGAPAQNEGGVDLTLPHGTPIYALGTGTLQGFGTFNHADGSPGYGVLTERTNVPGLGAANVYYQHINLNTSAFKNCGNGNCGNQVVLRGQLIGWTRPDMYGLEVGINPKWGGVWGNANSPGAWQTDPRQYLKALALGGGAVPGATGSNAPGATGSSATGTPGNCTPPSSALDVGGAISYALCQLQSTLVSFGEHIAVFLIGLLLIGAGIYLLGHKQINAAVGQAVKTTAKAGEAAAL